MITNKLKLIATVSLDFYNNNIKTINVKQCDTNSRFIHVSLTENGKKFTLNQSTMSVIARYKKPDGKFGFKDCEILEDGSALIELTEQMTVVSGKTQLDVMILETSGVKADSFADTNSFEELGVAVLSTMPLNLNIISTPIQGAELESEYDFTPLNECFASVKAIESDIMQKNIEWTNAEEQRETRVAKLIEDCESKTEEAIDKTNTATSNANTATFSAINATENANNAAFSANSAAERANSEAEKCKGVYQEVNQNAETVIEECENARDRAHSAAQNCKDVLESVIIQSDWNATDITGGAIKNKPPIECGEGEDSLQQESNKAIGNNAIALGKSSIAGCRGYHFKSIDLTNSIIYLCNEKISPNISEMDNTDETFETPAYTVGSKFCIINGSHYVLCGTITSIEHNVIKYNGDLGFTTIAKDEDPEGHTLFVPSMPTVGTVMVTNVSYAIGEGAIASGRSGHAEGRDTLVAGNYGHAEGRGTVAGYAAHAEGVYSDASGLYAHAEGQYTKALGNEAHAEGLYSQSLGKASHAEGRETQATSSCAHAEGNGTKATSSCAHAEGYLSKATGVYSHAEGYETKAISSCAHTEGHHTEASGYGSHAEGNGTKAEGQYSHAEGQSTTASGYGSHAEGQCATASGLCSHAEGRGVIAKGQGSHAEGGNITGNGEYTTAEGRFSHAEGSGTMSKGEYSHAEGRLSQALKDTSHAEGLNTRAYHVSQHVQGMYNLYVPVEKQTENDEHYLHIVGNGSGGNSKPTVRSNAHTLDFQGNAWYQGSVQSTGSDYAEYFEWTDSNPNAEDRVGYIVTLDGEKIRFASQGEEVLGIISGTVAVLGDNYECEWNGKYLRDEFGRVIYDSVEEFIEVPNIEIKENEVIETVEQKSLGFFKRPRLNPEYDPTQDYVNRNNRPEWDAVGMLGKLFVRDDGTAEVNGYITVGENGIATKSEEKTNMRVLSRVNENIIRVLLK